MLIHPTAVAAVAAGEILLAASGVADSLQLVGLATALGVGLAVGRVKRKDATIHDLEKALEGKQERLDESKEHLAGAQKRADEEHEQVRACERRIASLEGELQEVRRYTAQGALGELKEIIERATLDAAERNAAMSERQERIEKAIVGAVESQGELVLKNTELIARLLQHLGERTGGLSAQSGVDDIQD